MNLTLEHVLPIPEHVTVTIIMDCTNSVALLEARNASYYKIVVIVPLARQEKDIIRKSGVAVIGQSGCRFYEQERSRT